MKQLNKAASNPKNQFDWFVKAAKQIEYFVEKAEKNVHQKTFKGLFYSVIILFLLCLFGVLAILFVIGVGTLFPANLQWISQAIVLLIFAGLLYFFYRLIVS